MKSGFYQQMKAEVYAAIGGEQQSKGNWQAYLKFTLFISGVIIPYCLLLTQGLSLAENIGLLSIIQLFVILLMLNILHDVMHGSFSHKAFFKDWISYLLDIIGPSSFIWKIKHNISHHTYTNNSKLDNDINVSVILRFCDKHPHIKLHRYQHLYITPVYLLQCFFWFYISDFKNIIRGTIATKKINGFQGREKFLFFFNKLIHIGLTIVLPAQVFGLTNALLGYLCFYALLGYLLALIFQVAHIFVGTQFNEVEKFTGQDHWARLQLEGSCIFAPESKIGYWLYGGLQFQAIHHLFPDICHVHFPKIYPIVKKHCVQNGITLHTLPSLAAAIGSHYRQLYLLGQG